MSEHLDFICVSCNDEFTEEQMEDNAWQCPTCKMPITGSSSQLAHDYDELEQRVKALEEQLRVARSLHDSLQMLLDPQAKASSFNKSLRHALQEEQ